MAGGVFLWGWDYQVLPIVAEWRPVRVDTTGHLMVVPGAAATFDTHCYGYNGGAWQRLRVETAADANLRVRLYAGGAAIYAELGSTIGIADARLGLVVDSRLRLEDTSVSNWQEWRVALNIGDAEVGNRFPSVALMGWNGGSYDRLRVMTPADAFVTPTMALQVSSFLMGYDGVDWNMVRVDAAGHLQIDVLSSALPALAATAANQVLINANLATLVTEQGRCYGYDGSNWQTLLVESAVLKNLRVALYEGGTLAAIRQLTTTYGLINSLASISFTYGYSGSNEYKRVDATEVDADARSTAHRALHVLSYLYGYNGSTWDRLRTYGTGILKVGRAEVGLLTARMAAAGQVGAAGARKLYWMVLNPSAGLSLFELSDATAALQPIVLDHFDTTRDGHIMTFDPPMEFSNGIYLETFTNLTSIIFGYL